MDSLLAAAGNFDDLLDQLEQEESKDTKKSKTTSTKDARTSTKPKRTPAKSTNVSIKGSAKLQKLNYEVEQQQSSLITPINSCSDLHPHEVTTSSSKNRMEVPFLPNLIDISDGVLEINTQSVSNQVKTPTPSSVDLLLQIDDIGFSSQPTLLDNDLLPSIDLFNTEQSAHKNNADKGNNVVSEKINNNAVSTSIEPLQSKFIPNDTLLNNSHLPNIIPAIEENVHTESFVDVEVPFSQSVEDLPSASHVDYTMPSINDKAVFKTENKISSFSHNKTMQVQNVQVSGDCTAKLSNLYNSPNESKLDGDLGYYTKSSIQAVANKNVPNNEKAQVTASCVEVQQHLEEFPDSGEYVKSLSNNENSFCGLTDLTDKTTSESFLVIEDSRGSVENIVQIPGKTTAKNNSFQPSTLQDTFNKGTSTSGETNESGEGAVGFTDSIVDISDSELNEFMESDEIMASILSCEPNDASNISSSETDIPIEISTQNLYRMKSQGTEEDHQSNQSNSQQTDNLNELELNTVPHSMSLLPNMTVDQQPPSYHVDEELATNSTTTGSDQYQSNQGDMIDNIQVMPFETLEVEDNSQHHQLTQQSQSGQPALASTLGEQKPTWVPDSDAPSCSQCESKFTFTRRRHHCRACGKIFCSSCCYHKTTLKYMKSQKEERVCSMCYSLILHATAPIPEPTIPEPEAPSTSTTADQTQSVRTRTNPQAVPGPKSVRFADGTRPDRPQETPLTPPMPQRGPRHKKLKPHSPNSNAIPPVVVSKRNNKPYQVEENPDSNYISAILSSEGPDALEFLINQNLLVKVRFLMCGSRHCWCFWTCGMDSVGQNELAILFEREGLGDVKLPNDVFMIFTQLFERARRGKVVNNYDLVSASTFGFDKDQLWCGSALNAGIIFVQPTYQFFCGFYPGDPHRDPNVEHKKYFSVLFGLLVHHSESPWAALVPKRLLLRLGAQFNQYPCPLFSTRQRESTFSDIGHTILGILCDFTHFKYKVMAVPGLNVIVSLSGKVSLQIPCNRFTDIIKIINSSSNESVFAVASGAIVPPKFNAAPDDDDDFEGDYQMDSHLVCAQNTTALNYRTELLAIKNLPPKHTGAVFIVFNGSLHSDEQNRIKTTIIEDGVMVQLLPERMSELISALKAMEDFEISNEGASAMSVPNNSAMHSMEIKWVKDDKSFNIGLFSPIDFLSFEGILGFNVQGRSEQKGQKHIIRWNQVFFISNSGDTLDTSRLAEQIANSVFLALTPLLQDLLKNEQTKLSVRVTIHPDDVSYLAGSRGNPLPLSCMNSLDDELVATIHNASSNLQSDSDPIVLELLFSVLNMRFYYHTTNNDM